MNSGYRKWLSDLLSIKKYYSLLTGMTLRYRLHAKYKHYRLIAQFKAFNIVLRPKIGKYNNKNITKKLNNVYLQPGILANVPFHEPSP